MTAAVEVPEFAVPRPALIDRVDTAVKGKLTSIVAPPGFGKSMLLRQWVAGRSDEPPAWLRLSPRDDHGLRLATRLVAALGALEPGIGKTALERVDPTGEAMGDHFIAQLLEELHLLDPAVLVLDEVDTLANQRLLLDVRALIQHSSPNLSVIVATRVGLRDLASDGETTHFLLDDLAFSHRDARLLLERLSGRVLTDRQLDDLVRKTEGWPAGLQLSGLALRAGTDPDEFIERLSGKDEFIGRYLANEVLGNEPEPVCHFLLLTSVLRWLSGPLCDALTGDTSGREMLSLLQRKSMFLSREDRTGEWLRYHRLFRDLIRSELQTSMPEKEGPLLRAAAEWHLSRGDVERAVTYLIEAEEWDRVLDLVASEGRSLFERGQPAIALQWLEKVPAGVRAERKLVVLQEAMLNTMLGKTHVSSELVGHLNRTVPLSAGDLLAVNAIRATWVDTHASQASAIAAADAVLEALPTTPVDEIPDVFGLTSPDSLHFVALICRARALWYGGDVDGARQGLRALTENDVPYAPWSIHALGSLALLEGWSGRLHLAHQLAVRALVLSSRSDHVGHPATVDGLLALGMVSRERGLPGRAALSLDQAQAIATNVRPSVTIAVHAIERALLDLSAGEPRRGLDRLSDFQSSGHGKPPPLIAGRLRACEAQLCLAVGDATTAERLSQVSEGPLLAEFATLAAQRAIYSGDTAAARKVLDAWPHDGELRSALLRSLWTAVVDHEDGKLQKARYGIAETVALAEPEGHVRLFVDAGPKALRLVRSLERRHPTAYLSRVIESDSAQGERPATHLDDAAVSLSDRQLLVLRYLPSRLSNAEIAAQLYVSLNTVKTHLRSIYHCLGVTGRREAVERAEQLGLL